MNGCDIPRALKDYQENKTLSQVANCLANIENLLLNKPEGRQRKEEFEVEDERKQVPAMTKTNSRTRTKSKLEKQGTDSSSSSGQKKARRLSLPEKARAPNKRESTTKAKIEIQDAVSSSASGQKKPQRRSLPEKTRTSSRRESSSNTSNDEKSRQQRSNLEKKNFKGESKLHMACTKGDVAKVKELLSLGANPNTQDHAGWTPLHDVVSANRLDLAMLLLEAEANPSVPSLEERTTALHDAVTNGLEEIVRLLVSRGADRDAKDKLGHTPRYLAAQQGGQLTDILENTKIIVNLNETVKTNSQSRKMSLSVSRKLAKQPSTIKLCSELCQSVGLDRVSLEVTPSTTHLLVEEKETVSPDKYHYLAALVVGATIVRSSWLTESHQQGKMVQQEKFVVSFSDDDLQGVGKVQEMVAAQQPGLLAGIHFFLANNIGPASASGSASLSREDLASLIKLSGGRLVSREPDPEMVIPEEEISMPHHASPHSALAATSHVILYRPGEGEGEPLIKYNMNHLKSLPVTWLVRSIRAASLLDPQ